MDTPGSASGGRRQHVEVREIPIKLTVKRNGVKNIQVAVAELRRRIIKALLQIRRFCQKILN
jgi:hypothetical protein